MLPISVDLTQIRVILVGGGEAARRRLTLLDQAGAGALEVYAASPEPALAAAAGARLRRRLPRPAEIARAHLVFVARIPDPAAAEIRRAARAAGVLVNVEDDRRRSDFHSAAVFRRGDLTVAISTNGRSPGLAALMRRMLEQRFTPEWEMRLDQLATMRQAWREAGADSAMISRWTAEWVARHGWLDAAPPGHSRQTEPSQRETRPIP
jgi:precorrin-2 dehydrogenase/sirohydrochlorin ferrochelatase